jgi:hypothetical protein
VGEKERGGATEGERGKDGEGKGEERETHTHMEREREEMYFSSLKTIDNKKVLIVKLDINKLPSSSLGLLHSYILIKNFKSKVISILFSLKILKI